MSRFRHRAAVLIARGARPERGRTLLRPEDDLLAGARAASPSAGWSFLRRAGLAIVAGGFLAAAVTSTVGLSLTTAEQRAFIGLVLKDPPIAPVHYATCQALGEPTLRPIVDAVGQAPRRDDKAFGAGWFAVGVHPLVDLDLADALIGIGRYLAQVAPENRTPLLHQFFTAAAAIHDPLMKTLLDRIGALPAEVRDALMTASDEDVADALAQFRTLKLKANDIATLKEAIGKAEQEKNKEIATLKDEIGKVERQKMVEHQRLTVVLQNRYGQQWLSAACLREVEHLPFRTPRTPAPLAPKRPLLPPKGYSGG